MRIQWAVSGLVHVALISVTASGCASGQLLRLQEVTERQAVQIAELETELQVLRSSRDSIVVVAEAVHSARAALEAQLAVADRWSLVPGAHWEPVRFDVNSADIRESETRMLEEFAHVMRDRTELRIGLIGRADPRGSAEHNLLLSRQRAEAARTYLVDKGIDPSRIEIIATGASSPLVDASDAAAWAENRSVQPVVLAPGEPIDISSVPPGAEVYFFRMGAEWASVRNRLDDRSAILPYRVTQHTPLRVAQGRTWYNVMLVHNGRKRFACRFQVTSTGINEISVVFGDQDDPICP